MILTNPFHYKPLKRVDGNNGRRYVVGENRPLPSVTTVLGKTADKTFLVEWREGVGDEEADRIIKESTSIGNRLHDNLEQYVLKGTAPVGSLFEKILTKLVINNGLKHVDEVWGTEIQLYLPELYAGTTDLVGIHKGIPAIMDFKNSRQDKSRELVEDYFLQLVAYGEAHNATYQTDISKGVIMMASHSGKYLEFIIEGEEYNHYKKIWYNRLFEYYEKHGLE